MKYEEFLRVIDEKAGDCGAISDFLFDHPETRFEEFSAVERITSFLEKEGFDVKKGVVGIPTAFTATFGEGSPHFGVLAEYDALSGDSQVACITEKKPVEGENRFHGCGHNLFAAGSVAAVLAVKAYIEKNGKGRVTLFGCPAEEGGGGKVFMARDGVFDGVEAVVSWHPEKMYMVRTRPALANVKVTYYFEGMTAHAGSSPHLGRSALDAVELMNVGANFLREHMETTSRIHYAILDTGGTAANVVQSHASVNYLIRAVDNAAVIELFERVDRIAQGAALMTDTTFRREVESAYSNLITIPTLQATANEAMHDIPLPVPTEEDLEYGRALQMTMNLKPDVLAEDPYAMTVLDPAPPVAHGGSTDTADVSWVVPTVQMHIGNWVKGTPGHSWQAASQCRSSYAKRSAMYAGKAVAATIFRLLESPALLAAAKEEHRKKTGGRYICPLPEGAKPIIR